MHKRNLWHTLFINFSKFRFFWRVKKLYEFIKYSVLKQKVQVDSDLKSKREEASISYQILKLSSRDIIPIVLFTLLVHAIDAHFNLYDRITKFLYINSQALSDISYVSFLTAVSGIGGVFIALYYSGVMSIGSSIYSKAPNNIRDLLARETVGSVYMRIVSGLTFFSLISLVMNMVGFQKSIISIILILFLSGITIISFVLLGQRAFNLFDPVELSRQLFNDLELCRKRIQSTKTSNLDSSYQDYLRRKVKANLEKLNTISSILSQDNLKGSPFVKLGRLVTGYLLNYIKYKNIIPSDSKWYGVKYEHPDWYLSEDTTVYLAYETGTALHAKTIPDKYWIEDELTSILLQCLKYSLYDSKHENVIDSLTHLDIYVRRLSEIGEIEYAFKVVVQISDIILSHCLTYSKLQGKDEKLENLDMIDRLGLMPISILLSFSKSIEDFDAKRQIESISKNKWTNLFDLYKCNYDCFVLPRLEWLQKAIQLEYEIYGKKISPDWYIDELIRQKQIEKFKINLDLLSNISKNVYTVWYKKVNETQQQWLVASILGREWEYWDKIEAHHHIFENYLNALNIERRIKDLPWTDLDTQEINSKAKKQIINVIKRSADCCVQLSQTDRPSEYPDFEGRFLHAIGEIILDSIRDGDCKTVGDIFKHYFFLSLNKFEDLRPKDISEYNSLWRQKMAAAPLLDLLDLCGYVKLFSEFHSNPDLWKIVENEWDNYLPDEDCNKIIDSLTANLRITESAYEVAHRKTHRMRWRDKFYNFLLEYFELNRSDIRYGYEDVSIKHPSTYVRLLVRYGSLHYVDGISIFYHCYLSSKYTGEMIDLGKLRNSFPDKYQCEKENYHE